MTRLIVIAGFIILLILGCGPSPKPGDESATRQGDDIEVVTSPPGIEPLIDQYPVMIWEEIPVYPPSAQSRHIEGYVIINAFVDKSGKVNSVNAMKCSQPGYGLEKAATEAASKCRYRPAKSGGLPVGCWVTYKVDFVLDR